MSGFGFYDSFSRTQDGPDSRGRLLHAGRALSSRLRSGEQNEQLSSSEDLKHRLKHLIVVVLLYSSLSLVLILLFLLLSPVSLLFFFLFLLRLPFLHFLLFLRHIILLFLVSPPLPDETDVVATPFLALYDLPTRTGPSIQGGSNSPWRQTVPLESTMDAPTILGADTPYRYTSPDYSLKTLLLKMPVTAAVAC
ncbi:unnamed protein product [Protopolystoma xenopodis]|uniref:Uncharacterized protein n=1 Tax=Protopolystoma xenopodis TaxID=117903 RepID=A0A448WEV9_9PLAT|nr:unnamed protein product [Protopolystoma xenopodis]